MTTLTVFARFQKRDIDRDKGDPMIGTHVHMGPILKRAEEKVKVESRQV